MFHWGTAAAGSAKTFFFHTFVCGSAGRRETAGFLQFICITMYSTTPTPHLRVLRAHTVFAGHSVSIRLQ